MNRDNVKDPTFSRPCAHCNDYYGPLDFDYMVDNETWKEAGFDYFQLCHLNCLPRVLGRPLTAEMFPDWPINRAIRLGIEIGRAERKINPK